MLQQSQTPSEQETLDWLHKNAPETFQPSGGPATLPGEDETMKWLQAQQAQEQQQNAPPPSFLGQVREALPSGQQVKDFLSAVTPSPETTLRVGGGIIGGSIGGLGGTILGTPIGGIGGVATGGAAGAAAGEALYQIMQHLMAAGASHQVQSGAPQSAGEAANRIGNAALVGGLQEGIGAGFIPASTGALQSGATKQTMNLLAPVGSAEKRAVQGAAEELSQQMPMAATRQGLLTKFNTRLNDASTALEQAYNAVPANIRYKTNAVAQRLQQSQDALVVNGKVVPGAQPQYDAYQELLDWFHNNPSLSIKDLRTNRQLWDQLVRWGRTPGLGASQPPREAVYEEGANLLRHLINTTNPTIADLNHAVSLWKTGTDVLERSATRDVNRSGVTMSDLILGSVGGALGRAAGLPGGTEVGAVVAPAVRHLMGSPAWQTASINSRQAFIRLLNSGVPWGRAVGVLTGAALGPSPPPPSSMPQR